MEGGGREGRQLLPLAGAGLVSRDSLSRQLLPRTGLAACKHSINCGNLFFRTYGNIFFRTYGNIFPYIRNYFSVHTELFFRTYGIFLLWRSGGSALGGCSGCDGSTPPPHPTPPGPCGTGNPCSMHLLSLAQLGCGSRGNTTRHDADARIRRASRLMVFRLSF